MQSHPVIAFHQTMLILIEVIGKHYSILPTNLFGIVEHGMLSILFRTIN